MSKKNDNGEDVHPRMIYTTRLQNLVHIER